MMENNCLFLRQGPIIIVNEEQFVSDRHRGSASDHFWEGVDDDCNVWVHRDYNLACWGIFECHAEIVVNRANRLFQVLAVDNFEPGNDIQECAAVFAGEGKIVNVPAHGELGSIDCLVCHAGVIRVEHKAHAHEISKALLSMP